MGFFNKLFGGQPSSARDHFEQGLACEANTDHQGSLASFSEAIRLDPELADAYYARAFVREITGDFERAIADFKRVIELNPATGDELVVESDGDTGAARVIRIGSGITWSEGLVEAGASIDIARVCYTRGVQRVDAGAFDEAIADFSEAIDLTQYDEVWGQPFGPLHPAGMYFERGRCYSRTDRLAEAVADLEEIADFEVPDQEFRFHVTLLLGQCLAQLARHDEAIASLTKAIGHNAASPEAYMGRAFAHAEKKDLARAISDATEAIRLAPTQSTTHAARASIHEQAGDHTQAAADYSEAIRLEPESPALYQLRAREYQALGDKESAARDARTIQALTYLQQTLSDIQKGDWERAMPVFDQVIELDPTLHRGYLRRGLGHLARQEPDRAIADFNHIIDKLAKPVLNWGPTFGAYVDAFVNRGNAHMMKREFQKAIADYSEGIRLEPKLAPAYEHRAEAYRTIGDGDKAKRDERTAKELQG